MNISIAKSYFSLWGWEACFVLVLGVVCVHHLILHIYVKGWLSVLQKLKWTISEYSFQKILLGGISLHATVKLSSVKTTVHHCGKFCVAEWEDN